MLILLLLSALRLSSSVPLESFDVDDASHLSLSVIKRDPPELANVLHYRTIQDIVWSCLATIFACTWVAVHLNLPGPQESGWRVFKRKVVTMIYAILAPEFMAVWAMRQHIAARRIVNEYNKSVERTPCRWYLVLPSALKECCGAMWTAVVAWFRDSHADLSQSWTLTHGFFVQMGGFVLYDDDTPLRVLTYRDFEKLIAEGKVATPKISEDEINDKSKGDSLTKLFAVVQTTWFVFQCFARWANHLPVTELEVVTLAFAALNVVTYGFWWKKPQGVLVAVRVQLNGGVDGVQGDGDEVRGDGDAVAQDGDENEELHGSIGEKEGYMTRKKRKTVMAGGWLWWLYCIPFQLVGATLRPLHKMWDPSPSKVIPQSLRVPMFSADDADNNAAKFPFAVVSILFGCIHLISWSSSTLPAGERWIWDSATLVIIVEPVLFNLVTLAGITNKRFDDKLSLLLFFWFAIPSVLGAPLYILARVSLLGLAFIDLRQLPPEAYTTIEWASFVPHI